MAAVLYAIEHPEKGINFSEDLPHETILKMVTPYLGQVISIPVDWTPLMNKKPSYLHFTDKKRDESDPWQFNNFVY